MLPNRGFACTPDHHLRAPVQFYYHDQGHAMYIRRRGGTVTSVVITHVGHLSSCCCVHVSQLCGSHPACMKCPAAGALMRIEGLKAQAKLNGQQAVVMEFMADTGRYKVLLQASGLRCVGSAEWSEG